MIHRKSLITSHQHTDAHQVSEEELPWKVKPPIRYPGLIAERYAMMYGMGYPFAESGPAVQAVSPLSSLATPGLLAGVGTAREEEP